MLAFHNDPKIKDKYLTRVRFHKKADEIVKGKFWENGKGGAVGCTVHSSDHKAYEEELGIPEWLARVENAIFEGLPDKKASQWPEEFLSAIKPGADLEKVKTPFLIFVLNSALNKFDHIAFPNVKKSIDTVISLYEDVETDIKRFKKAWAAARTEEEEAKKAWAGARTEEAEAKKAWAGAWASWTAAWASWAAAAARTEEAAGTAAEADEAEARTAAEASWAAAWASWAGAAAVRTAAAAAGTEAGAAAEYEKFADELLQLLRNT